MRDLKLVDRKGAVIRLVKESDVEALIKTGKVEHVNIGKRGEKLRLTCGLTVADFKRSGRGVIKAPPKTHYRETIGDGADVQRPYALKRLNERGGFSGWDNELTFEELRSGATRHAGAEEDEADEAERRLCKCSAENNAGLPSGAVCLTCGGLVSHEREAA